MPEFTSTNNHLAELEAQLERLATATNEIGNARDAATDVIKACQSMQADLGQVVESIGEATTQAQERIGSLQQTTSKAIKTVQKDALDRSRQTLEVIEAVKDEIHTVLTEISQVDFPSRLDKLDNTVSAINIGTQNLMTVCNGVSKKNDDLTKVCYRVSKKNDDLTKVCYRVSKKNDALESKLSTQQKLIVGGFIVVLLVQAVFQFLF